MSVVPNSLLLTFMSLIYKPQPLSCVWQNNPLFEYFESPLWRLADGCEHGRPQFSSLLRMVLNKSFSALFSAVCKMGITISHDSYGAVKKEETNKIKTEKQYMH